MPIISHDTMPVRHAESEAPAAGGGEAAPANRKRAAEKSLLTYLRTKLSKHLPTNPREQMPFST